MKETIFILTFLSLYCHSIAQNDTTRVPFEFGVKMSLGHLKGDYINGNKNISSGCYAPQIELGRKLKFNIGAIILRTDSLSAADTFGQKLSRLAIGFSFKEHLGKSNLYMQGSYSLLLRENIGPEKEGHYILLEIGQTMPDTYVDLFLSAGRLFDKEKIYTGTTFNFGIRLFGQW